MERRGSTRVITAVKPGEIRFDMDLDTWSAGDRGVSRQLIPGIGKARGIAARQTFWLFEKYEVPSHFLDSDGPHAFVALEMAVEGQEPLSGKTEGEALPLEWIDRHYLEGSLWKAVERDEIDPVKLGFERGYKPKWGDKLPQPHCSCTTKREAVDRKLSNEEARDLAKLRPSEWHDAWKLVLHASRVISTHALRRKYRRLDGKKEVARLWSGQLIIMDTGGTPDEDRFIHVDTGELYSKDIIRRHLDEVGYMAELEIAKRAHPTDKSKWPDYPELPTGLVSLVQQRYPQFAADYSR